jgi:hypothetical protein
MKDEFPLFSDFTRARGMIEGLEDSMVEQDEL